MKKLDIRTYCKNYHSDSIEHGRIAKEFFLELAENIFKQSFKYWENYGKNEDCFPILYSEECSKSTFAVALDKITPVHMSEVSFYKEDLKKTRSKNQQSRAVDFWCETENKVNYFIELKHGHYCISEGTEDKPHCKSEKKKKELIEQIDDVKKIKPEWGDKEIYLGVMIYPGYYNKKKESIENSEKKLCDHLNEKLDKKKGVEIISSTWFLPEKVKKTMIEDEDLKNTYDWISIVGFVLTKKRV